MKFYYFYLIFFIGFHKENELTKEENVENYLPLGLLHANFFSEDF